MHKQELLSLIKGALESGTLTSAEVDAVTEEFDVVKAGPEAHMFMGTKKFSAASILYLIGGIVVLIGIWTFIWRFWADLSSVIRIVITLGLSLAAFVAGILLKENRETAGIAVVMQFLSGILAPIGIYVTLNEFHVAHLWSSGWSTSIALVLLVIYGVALIVFRSAMFALFATIFGTWAAYAGVTYFLQDMSSTTLVDTYKYLTLALGVGFFFIGGAIGDGPMRVIKRVYYWLGSLGVYGAVLFLGSYKPSQSYMWEWIGIAVAIGGLYLSSKLQNRSLLKSTSVFILILIAKFTAEYFADSVGWPVALIIGGFVLIGAGFGVLKLSKKVGTANKV